LNLSKKLFILLLASFLKTSQTVSSASIKIYLEDTPMTRRLVLIVFFVIIVISLPLQAAKKQLKKAQPVINARAAVLMDAATGQTLFSRNGGAIMAPASTTKIMTAVLVLEKLNLARTITIDNAPTEGTSVDLTVGERKTVLELLYGLMMVSGNDAAYELAETVSGTEAKFAMLMTQKAKQIGMKNTVFKNASGLPVIGHATTAWDMAVLTRYALKKPNFCKLVRTKYKYISGSTPGTVRQLKNHNKLLWKYPYAIGVKTGYTVTAGGCLVAAAQYRGKVLIAVVLNTGAIYDDCIAMFNYGFGLK
jgi:D-alanyl-D-alanine carboxypeptidase (penicillin-binding protein 5/6)